MNICTNCNRDFEVTDQDRSFYKKVSPVFSTQTFAIAEPTFCPSCRQQRRLSWRNEINLFQTVCAKTSHPILSMYAPDSGYVIYDHTEWWKDDWDPLQYARDVDFSRPFFEQLSDLQRVVPRMSLNSIANENSYYTNYAARNKDSYLLTTADLNEQSCYGRFSQRNYQCLDFDFTNDSRHSYETLDTENSERCFFSQKIDQSSDLYFCYDMRGCHNCLFSAGLRNQTYMIFNKPVSPEEFERIKGELKLNTRSGVKAALEQAQEFWKTTPRKALEMTQCEECLGDHVRNSKNAQYCFDSTQLQNVNFGSQLENVRDSYDWDFFGHGELCYEMVSAAYGLHRCLFTMNSWDGNTNVLYSDLCLGNENLFGCVGLRKKKYCILNKQYTPEAYETLAAKLATHMQETGEWGQFMPAALSTFAYNDSVAFEYFPLTKEDALERGLKWRDPDPADYGQQSIPPDDIDAVETDILSAIFSCTSCSKKYKLQGQELAFYKEYHLPVPNTCWRCRHKRRMALRNPRVIYDRTCAKCSKVIQTTYAPDRTETVYCESCYYGQVA